MTYMTDKPLMILPINEVNNLELEALSLGVSRGIFSSSTSISLLSISTYEEDAATPAAPEEKLWYDVSAIM